MAKFFGQIGYSIIDNTAPGSYTPSVIERDYCGDVVRVVQKAESSTDSSNDDVNVTNEISIIGDPFCFEHLSDIKYVVWMGGRWKVRSIEYLPPRFKLTIGGVYNGPGQNC